MGSIFKKIQLHLFMWLCRYLRPLYKLNQERIDLPKTQKPPKTSKRQKGDMKQV
jgi:hypothetical protein